MKTEWLHILVMIVWWIPWLSSNVWSLYCWLVIGFLMWLVDCERMDIAYMIVIFKLGAYIRAVRRWDYGWDVLSKYSHEMRGFMWFLCYNFWEEGDLIKCAPLSWKVMIEMCHKDQIVYIWRKGGEDSFFHM